LFRDPDNGDFHLQDNIDCGDASYSPCIDAGDPSLMDYLNDCAWGLGNERSDMGAFGGEGYQTDIEDDDKPTLPTGFTLNQNFPNPFNATTTITFNLAKTGGVNLSVYNLMGQKVEILMDNNLQAGQHRITWDASTYSSGIYFYKLSAGDKTFTNRMTLLK